MGISKRGLSDIVTNVLIILLVLVAIGIIWYFVSPFITNSASSLNSAQQYSIHIDIVRSSAIVDDVADSAQVSVRRGTGKGNLTGVNIVLEDTNGVSRVFRQNVTLEELETRVFSFSYAGQGLGSIKVISIAPIIMVGTQEIIGAIADKESTGAGTVTVISCPLDYNNDGTLTVLDGTSAPSSAQAYAVFETLLRVNEGVTPISSVCGSQVGCFYDANDDHRINDDDSQCMFAASQGQPNETGCAMDIMEYYDWDDDGNVANGFSHDQTIDPLLESFSFQDRASALTDNPALAPGCEGY